MWALMAWIVSLWRRRQPSAWATDKPHAPVRQALPAMQFIASMRASWFAPIHAPPPRLHG
ncbi:MAG: hypothetical protein EOO32_05400 [Comamonadaceae bacterium]|nr:MAG: hypothetical protein EOO32_05400 [Comamonadaceae bacterium]